MSTESVLMGRDNYGNTWGPLDPKAPKKSLLDDMCRNSAVPMMRDTKTGHRHVGYVVKPPRGSHEVELWVEFYWENNAPWSGPNSYKP
jgi:hypothetical protein